ncbi:DUF637 domain-containing protein [Pseudomonas sp. McL0111]|uniref:DUF637 domain-containing protein n=1 Tax=Pseudomonas sp. McL0111 TaxID=3457357 RepID=UPI00403E8132
MIETNPVLTDLKSFMSSDYLLGKLGYDPDQSAKRLGDGLYEQRLIQQAVTARTGQAFLDGQTSNEGMFKYLMNNAIASKDALNLSVGVGLSAQQVAALTHDIVWLEEHEVNGEKVLVPVVYLAQANGRLGPTGALIAGNDVTLIAGENLDNVGTLKATNNLSATAGKDLVNSGSIEAGNRLDLLATNNIVNKAGGIIAGRDVSLTTRTGDVINERTITSSDNSTRYGTQHHDYADNAARIEAANDLTVKAANDINISGGVMQSGRDMALSAGRDVNVSSVQVNNSVFQDAKHNTSDVTQLGADIDAGRDFKAEAKRDINIIASEIDAKRDVAMTATENMVISSAADEEHSLSKSKKVTRQEDHVSQVMSGITAGGDVKLDAGKDLSVISSRVTAGDEAYLVAGENLNVLALQDTDYSLYDMKKKGSFGKLKMKHDEVTDNKHVGSEIKAGGDLTLKSGGDQLYQVAKLESGNNITLDSGGAITFEGVKDLHDESHTKTNNNAAWVSAKGRGNTDEALRQTQMIAKGNIVLKAVDGLKIDIKDVNQQSVSQTIDTMVKADPQLAWLKEAEARGDVDWRLVKEIHESFKYENSGLGPASQIIIAIIMAAVVGPAALTAFGGMGTFWAATFAAVATGAATNATTSFINNGGNLGAVFADVTSSDALKGYAISGLTAGLMSEYLTKLTGMKYDPVTKKLLGPSLATWEGVGRFAGSQIIQGGTSALITKAAGGDASVGDVLKTALFNTVAAFSFNMVGDLTKNVMDDGSAGKIIIHAAVGGLLSEMTGGDFATGALAAGANEALVGEMNKWFEGNPDLLLMGSQIVGVLSATALGNTDATTLQQTAWITNNATQYNFAGHQELDDLENAARTCEAKGTCEEVKKYIRDQSVADDDALSSLCKSSPQQCIQYYGDLVHDRFSLQERLAHMYFDDSIPSMFKEDLHRLQLQNNTAIATLTQAQSQLDLINSGVSPEKAGWLSDLLAVMGGVLRGGKGGGAKGIGSSTEAGSVFTQQRNFWSKDPIQFSGNKVYQRNDLFDPNLQTSWREGGKVITGSNAERMAAPIGVDGKSVNLHHMTQTQSGPIAEMTQSFHQTNSATIHINPNTIPSGIDRAAFDKWKVQYWQQRSADFRN